MSSILKKQLLDEKISSSTKVITPKINLINPQKDKVNCQDKCVVPTELESLSKLKKELLTNRKSTPRPSILLLNKLGEGKMIELDLESLKRISLHNRRASRLGIKIANQIIKEERRKSILASYANNTLDLSPSQDHQAEKSHQESVSEHSENSDCESSVSSLQAADFEFLAESPELKNCLHEEAIKVSSIKLAATTPKKCLKRFSILAGESSSKKPLQSTVAKQMMKNLLQDDLTKFIYVKIYG